MKFSIAASALALAATAAAAPSPQTSPFGFGCINQANVEAVLQPFEQAFQHLPSPQAANATLQALIANNFEEISDSILSLEGRPLGGPSTPTKAAYINGLIGNAPTTGLETILAAPCTCNSFIWQWTFTGVGDKQYEVKGFNRFVLNQFNQIETLYVEFNSIAWALDTGYTITFPPGPPPS